ncbi:MAG: phospholipase [Reichenbachiella sp.]
MEKNVEFNITAPFCTLNELTKETTDLWIVCHGFGQMAKHFIRRFDVLDKQSNYVIALQGLSRFYFDQYQKVGASWMTRENKDIDLKNQKSYFDAVLSNVLNGESLNDFNVHLLGFSQGVAMVSRMAAYRKIDFKNLIVWAGSFPAELKKDQFKHLSDESKLTVVLGDKDEYIPIGENFDIAVKHAETVLGRTAEIVTFQGGHEMSREVLSSLKI